MTDKNNQGKKQDTPQTWGWDKRMATFVFKNMPFPQVFSGIEPFVIDNKARKAINLESAERSEALGRHVVVTGTDKRKLVHGGMPLEFLTDTQYMMTPYVDALMDQAYWGRLTVEEKDGEGLIRKCEIHMDPVRRDAENKLPEGFVPARQIIAFVESLRGRTLWVRGCWVNPVRKDYFDANLVVIWTAEDSEERPSSQMAFQVKGGHLRIVVPAPPTRWLFKGGLHDPAKMGAQEAIVALKLMPQKKGHYRQSKGGKPAPHSPEARADDSDD